MILRPDALLTYEDAAALLNVSLVSIRRWAAAGQLPVTRMGRRVCRIDRQALEAWASARTSGLETALALGAEVSRSICPKVERG